MNVYLKHFRMQRFLFLGFFFLGMFVLSKGVVPKETTWVNYVALGILVAITVVTIIFYKKAKDAIIFIKQSYFKTIKMILYGYFIVYVIQMILTTKPTTYQNLVSILAGTFLMLIALGGVIYQFLTVKK